MLKHGGKVAVELKVEKELTPSITWTQLGSGSVETVKTAWKLRSTGWPLAYREPHTPNTRSHFAGGHNWFRRLDSLCCKNANIIAVDISYELFYDEFFKRYDSYGQ